MRSFTRVLKAIFQWVSLFPVITLFSIVTIILLLLPKRITNPQPIVETWCAQIQQYDSVKKSIITYYNPAVIQDSELLSVQLFNGVTYFKKDFLTGNELDYNLVSNVITKQGVHFKITLLKMDKCGSKVEMDTLAKEDNESNQENPNN